MLKTLGAFIKKETLHILRDTRTLVILFGMPIALVLIFGYTVTNEFKNAPIAIVDKSKDDLSSDLIQHITASGHFQLVKIYETETLIEAGFRSGEVKLAIIIPPKFESEFYKNKATSLQLIADASEPNYATTLTNYATQMIVAFQNQRGGLEKLPFSIETEIRMYYNPTLNSAYNFVPGVAALLLMLVCAMMTSLTIAKEKELGTMDLLLVSPLPPIIIIVGKVIPYVVLAFLDALIVFAMGYYIFDVPIIGSFPLLLACCLLYLFVSLALGILISTMSDNQEAAMMTSMFSLMMPTMLLSGFLFPITSMPWLLQMISAIVPAKYFVDVEVAIMLKGAGWESITFPIMILSIMLVVLLVMSWKKFKVIYE